MATKSVKNLTITAVPIGQITGETRYMAMDKLIPPFGSSFERIGNTMNFSVLIAIDSSFTYNNNITLKTPSGTFNDIQYYLDCDYTVSSTPSQLNIWKVSGSFEVKSNSPLPSQNIEIFVTDNKNSSCETDDPVTSRGTKVTVKSGTGEI